MLYAFVHLGLRPLALAIIVGDALHKIADGIALGAAFSVSPSSGLSTTIATVCHEVPHEIGDFAVLLAAGLSVRNALLLNLASSFTALIGFYAVASATGSAEVQRWLLAITAGMFLHIALNDMVIVERNRVFVYFAANNLSLVPHHVDHFYNLVKNYHIVSPLTSETIYIVKYRL
uniref:Uncharacterized protein n=1 Tax=Eptatretus burgeri TaxID=7764 RepID=A0A8C4QKL0_EPTBU